MSLLSPVVELKSPDTVSLFCSVLEYDLCLHEVEWLYEGKEEKPSDMNMFQHACSATVTFPTSYIHGKLDIYQLLQCKVTDSITAKVQQFPFSAQSLGENMIQSLKSVQILALICQVFI